MLRSPNDVVRSLITGLQVADIRAVYRAHGVQLYRAAISGWGRTVGRTVVVSRDLPSGLEEWVLAHELGHALEERASEPWCDLFAGELIGSLRVRRVLQAGSPTHTGQGLGILYKGLAGRCLGAVAA